MKKIFSSLLLIAFLPFANASEFNLQDSLKKIESTNDMRTKAEVNLRIAYYYMYMKGDSGLYYLAKVEKISKENDLIDMLPATYSGMFQIESKVTSNYPMALYHAFEGQKYLNQMRDRPIDPRENKYARNYDDADFDIAYSYAFLGNKEKALEYMNKAPKELFIPRQPDAFYKKLGYTEISVMGVLAQFEILVQDYKKAKLFISRALEINRSQSYQNQWCQPFIVYADILMHDKKYDSATYYYKLGINLAIKDGYYKDVLEANLGAANAYNNLGKIDSAIYHANNVINLSGDYTFTEGLLKTNLLLYNLYKQKGNRDSTLKYLEGAEVLRDQIFNNTKANDAQNMAINEEVKQRELKEQKAKQQKILIITALGAILLAIGIYLNGKRKQRERLRQIEEERKNSELKAARDLQQSMLPKENPKRHDLDIATFIRSSTEVGGDYYDFFPQADGSIFSVCGDATGHGVTSGMMVSVTKAGLNGISPVKPNKILQRLNGVVKRIDLGTLRMSLNIAEITNDEVYLSSAAMPPIYLYKASTKTIEEFMNNGLPLGGLRDEEFVLEARNFESGDVLVQLSDGLPEAPNSKGEMYDYERLKSLILASVHLSAEEIIKVLMKSVDEWMEGKHNPDDITLVVTKKK
jgi:serine phosphatase RsbU (regulator of sigma subunit)